MKKIYIGINANNAICNDSFFDGSITLYPTGEKGNIFYTTIKVEKTNTFISNEYKTFVITQINELRKKYDDDVCFMIINKKVLDMCKNESAKFITNLNIPIVDKLNDKRFTRELFEDKIPMLEYQWYQGANDIIDALLKSTTGELVLQKDKGAGGDSTYLIDDRASDIKLLIKNNDNYCISKYTKNIPLNITAVIGENQNILLPLSAQLISIEDRKFKYVGGDFAYIKNIDKTLISRVNEYTEIILDELQKEGYLGIIGIDYILTEDNQIKFMEINPRFQSSSFLLSKELEKSDNTNIGKLHYDALSKNQLDRISITSINKSFVNCNKSNNYDFLKNESECIYNGYYDVNETAIYRKVFNRSIINEGKFEKI